MNPGHILDIDTADVSHVATVQSTIQNVFFPKSFKLNGPRSVFTTTHKHAQTPGSFNSMSPKNYQSLLMKRAEKCDVNRNFPETQSSAAKHTPHSYTPASSLSSSSLHPCCTDFKLSRQECVHGCSCVFVCVCVWVGLSL